jgi:hypothetical protein
MEVELATDSANGAPGAYAVRGRGPVSESFSQWSITADRKLRVVVSTGFEGVTAELAPSGGGLKGIAHTWTDVLESWQWARVRAERTVCPGEQARRRTRG